MKQRPVLFWLWLIPSVLWWIGAVFLSELFGSGSTVFAFGQLFEEVALSLLPPALLAALGGIILHVAKARPPPGTTMPAPGTVQAPAPGNFRNIMRVLGVLLGLHLLLWFGPSATSYEGAPIHGVVRDAATKQPLQGVTVTATWSLEGGLEGGNWYGFLAVGEAVTDAQGRYSIAGWGRTIAPLDLPRDVRMHSDEPALTLFKSGYEIGTLYNNQQPMGHVHGLLRSDWDGKSVELRPFKGDLPDYAKAVDSLKDGLDWQLEAQCNWRRMPQLLGALIAQDERFAAARIAGRGLLDTLAADAANNGGRRACGSFAAFARQHWPAQVLPLALRDGDPDGVAAALQAGADPNVRDRDGTPAIRMAPRGAWAAIGALLAAPAIQVDAADGGALLRAAAAAGQGDIAQRLLALGADPNIADPESGGTALMAAAWHDNVDLVRALLARGANLNAVARQGGNVMSAAAPHPDTVKLLVAAGLVAGPTDVGGAPLLPKYMASQPELALQLIAAGVGLQDRDHYGNDLLACAARLGRADMMQAILKASPAPLPEADLAAAATAAVRGGHLEAVDFLLHHGLHAGGAEGQKVLAAVDNVQTLRQLLDLGFPARAPAGVGNDALVSAAADPYGDGAVIRLLLEHGADSNAEGMEGNRPLVEAARLGSIETVKLLLAHGANVQLANRDGVTPLMAAADRGFHEFMNVPRVVAQPAMNLQALGIVRPPPADATYMENGMMLSRGARQRPPADRQVHPALAKSLYPVMAADITFFTGRETPGIASALLDAGGRVDAKDADGRTALMRAAAAGFAQNAQLLLAHGASRSTKNGQGETAAGIAAAFRHEQLAEMLSSDRH